MEVHTVAVTVARRNIAVSYLGNVPAHHAHRYRWERAHFAQETDPRTVPKSEGDVSAGDRYSYGVDLHATNLRLVASKKLLVFDMAGGLGWDKYTGDAVIRFRDPISGLTQPPVPVELENTRVLGFLNAGMSLSVVRLTAEVGYQGGKDQELSTEFEDFDTTKGKFFAGLGLRVGF